MMRHDLFLLAAVAISFALSVSLWFLGRKEEGAFVGLWVPSILGLGIYLRLRLMEVKSHA
jgi:hypothetical protein